MPKRLAMVLTVLFTLGVGSVLSEDVLFHETFGDNSSSARAWDNSYSVKSGVPEVYKAVTYTMVNLKQSKNTVGCTESGLLQTTNGTDASIVLGPLNVSDYENLELSFMYKAGSVKGTYIRSAQYKTSSTASWADLTVVGTQNASTCSEQVATLPSAAAGISTLYIKIVFNTSNTGATIDEVGITGTKKACGSKVTINTTSDGHGAITATPTSIETCSDNDGDRQITITLNPNSHYSSNAPTISGITNATITGSGNTYTVQLPKGSNGTLSVSASFKEDDKYTVIWSADDATIYTEQVYVNEKVSVVPTISYIPEENRCGDKFVGWTIEAIPTPQDDAPGYFTTVADSPEITKDIIFYAVFADYKD